MDLHVNKQGEDDIVSVIYLYLFIYLEKKWILEKITLLIK